MPVQVKVTCHISNKNYIIILLYIKNLFQIIWSWALSNYITDLLHIKIKTTQLISKQNYIIVLLYIKIKTTPSLILVQNCIIVLLYIKIKTTQLTSNQNYITVLLYIKPT